MRTRLALASMVALVGAASPGLALANGRFPDAQQLVVDPNDPNHIAVQSTYGFIHTRDHGANWTWSCEDAAGYGGVLDPPIAIVDAGVLIAGVFDGLVVASPDSCDYGFVGGELTDRFILDVSTIKGDPAHAISLSSDGQGSNQFDTRVWKTTDGAQTWEQLGAALPTDFLAFTLDAVPGDESALYVSGFRVISSNDYVGTLAVSVDAGETWELKPIPGSANGSGPYIGAIDPANADTVYVRLASEEGTLLVTHDAGDTWATIFQGGGSLLGFALSPDGSEVRVGGDVDGIWGASVVDFDFSQVNDMGVRCLTWTEDALYGCAREAIAGFTIGQSFDGGGTFEPLHHLECLIGPDPACPSDSTVQQTCLAPWGAQQQILGTDTCADFPSTGGGGTGEGGAGAGTGGGGASDPEGGGCSCRTPADPSRSGSRGGGGLVVGALALLGLRLRRRS